MASLLQNHPVDDKPAFFVHPCNTAEALKDAIEQTSTVTPVQYLLLWMGIVGSRVGLRVPVALASQLARER